MGSEVKLNQPHQTANVSSDTLSEDEAKITLGLLNAIEANSAVTQRTVARDLGIALGLANAYLKRCVRKGLIKVQQVPANRYAYYLTPRGFAEKSQLTANYLSYSFNFFRGARNQCAGVIDNCISQGWRRVALAGVSDLGEIATLCIADSPAEAVGFYDASTSPSRFAGLPVFGQLKDLPKFDVIVVTDLNNPQGTFDDLIRSVSADRVLTPSLLSVSRNPPELME